MILAPSNLPLVDSTKVEKPAGDVSAYPEKVLQFGTGVLLRGLIDYFIDKANRLGVFKGRVVIVKSTSAGDIAAFQGQGGLYTQCIRGEQQGKKIAENIINSSISRVLSAGQHWEEVLNCAHNPELSIIVSNTTEVGLQLVKENVLGSTPKSFPGKLLALLFERYKAFNGAKDKGFIIIPTELVLDNGGRLKSIILELAGINKMEQRFIGWLLDCNHFCSSLVDRIVPGKPAPPMLEQLEKELGYQDELLIVSEVSRLWAIEGNEFIRSALSFAGCDEGVIVDQDIQQYRELKLRLLNGTHTLTCGLAFLAAIRTVKEAMEEPQLETYISQLMLNELVPSIPYRLDEAVATAYGKTVLDRFRNPFIHHNWLTITMQYSSKMKLRCIPMLEKYYSVNNRYPELFSLGFAAYLCFTRPVSVKDGKYYGFTNGHTYLIDDDYASIFYELWKDGDINALVNGILSDISLWGIDLTSLPGFENAICQLVNQLVKDGPRSVLSQTLSHTT